MSTCIAATYNVRLSLKELRSIPKGRHVNVYSNTFNVANIQNKQLKWIQISCNCACLIHYLFIMRGHSTGGVEEEDMSIYLQCTGSF